MLPALVVCAAYLLGSVPFGYLMVRVTGKGDVRETGSGGTGATNVTRRAGKGAGVLTLALDAAKGALAVLIARWMLAPGADVDWWVAASALAAIIGHVFPVWLGFRGGKGVATGLGVFLLLAPLAVAVAALIFLLIVWQTRYVSLGSIVAAAAIPFGVWLRGAATAQPTASLTPLLTTALVGSALIILMHHANIGRLLRGTENRLK
jgi:glycerol-3-phosphate acyltransferase PlsY